MRAPGAFSSVVYFPRLCPSEKMTQWAVANPKQVLVHRIEEARQVANRKRDDRQKRREKVAAADLRHADAEGR